MLIGVLKVVKAALLVVLAVGAIKLLDGNFADAVERWIQRLNMDAGNPVLDALLSKLQYISPRKLSFLSAGAFLCGVIFDGGDRAAPAETQGGILHDYHYGTIFAV